MIVRFAAALLLLGLLASPTRADEPAGDAPPPLAAEPTGDAEGQDDLAKAIEAKLSAQTIGDLGRVIELCQSAIAKGLNEEDESFAKKMLGGALFQRASVIAQPVFENDRADPEALKAAAQMRQAALANLQASLTQDATQPASHYLLARLQAVPGGDPSRAVTALNDALKLEPEDTELKAKILVLRASLTGDLPQRLADLNQAVELAPKEVEVRRARGLFLANIGRASEALADLNAAVELEPDQAGAYEARSLALAAGQQFDKALVDLEKAIELAPDSPLPKMQRARIKLLQNKPQEAIADLDAILEQAPRFAQALLVRSAAHRLAGNDAAAAEDLAQALPEGAKAAAGLRARATVLASLERFREAAIDLEQVLETEPNNIVVLAQLADVSLRIKQVPQAIDAWTRVLAIDGDNFTALQSRGDAWLSIGRQKEALADYEKAYKIQPEHSGLLNNLAWLLATSPDESLRDGKRATELATEACRLTEYRQAHILSTLAAGYAEAGNFDEAVAWSKKAVDTAAEPMKANLQKELASYEAQQPWREVQNIMDGGSADDAAPSDEPSASGEAKAPKAE